MDGDPLSLEICFGRYEGDGVVVLPQQSTSPGMELIPYADGEPIPLDWNLAMEVGNGGGY
jgi:hypothetical protein